MDGFFQKLNQKVNLGRRPTSDARPPPAGPDIAILKDIKKKRPKMKTLHGIIPIYTCLPL